MLNVALLTFLFSISTVVSITLIGSRDLIGGDIGLTRIIRIIFDWRFIVGAIFAFISRILFLYVNNALYKIPHLADSSTTLTVFVTSIATIFVIIANYYFLGEKISPMQWAGALAIFFGIFLVTR